MYNKPLISVIVPVYNVEEFLNKCISSIVNQTYSNLEIILVDDGSPDKSGQICDSWAEKDNRIRVIHQENAGGGAARNAALDIASGDLIAFVDSDDYISPDMYEYLCELIKQGADIVECAHIEAVDDSITFGYYDTDVRTYTVQEAMTEHICDRGFRQLIWNKLYRSDILREVRFPAVQGIDDEFFTYKAIANAKVLIHSDAVLYAYRQQASSIMHTINADRRLLAISAKQERHDYICRFFPELEQLSACSLWFTCLYQGQLALEEEDEQVKQKCMDYIKQIIALHPIRTGGCSIKEKIWLRMAKFSFEGTCIIRKHFKIGY